MLRLCFYKVIFKMLLTYLNNNLCKFILLEDDLEAPGGELFKYLIRHHCNLQKTEKQGPTGDLGPSATFLQFNFSIDKDIPQSNVVKLADLSSNDALDTCNNITKTHNYENNCIIIDSVALMIHKIGARNCYKFLSVLLKRPENFKIYGLLHSDLLLENDEIITHLASIASLHIKMERQFGNNPRLSYVYKKGRGKVAKDISEFGFDLNRKLILRPVSQINVKSLLADNANAPPINSLTTFNLELNEQDKINRSQLNLPFLPRELHTGSNETKQQKEGEIHYVFDAGDDWDAEDPDDDLDI